jgi:site-specific DNA-methyltransferase (adenine-specific)
MRKEQIGNATLYLGDCMELMAQYPDKHFDLAIVDPPYGAKDGVERTGGSWSKKYGGKIKEWDIAPHDKYFTELFRVSKYQIICGGNYFNLPPSRNFIIWRKHIAENFSMAMCEYLWTNIPGNAKFFKYPSCIEKDRFHPTQKPVALYKWLLSKYAKPGQKILDTHLGSGSSAVACNEMGYELTASEIDKDYFVAASKRIKEAYKQPLLIKQTEEVV